MTKTIAYIDANNAVVSGFAIPYDLQYAERFHKGFDIFSYIRNLASEHNWGEVEFKFFATPVNAAFQETKNTGNDPVANSQRMIGYAEANGAKLFLGRLKLKNMSALDRDGRKVDVVRHVEKKTDAFMTTEIVADSFRHEKPRMLIVTNDSDFSPPLTVARERGAELFLIAPANVTKNKNRPSRELTDLVKPENVIMITPNDVAAHLMPAPYRLKQGKRPIAEYVESDTANVWLMQSEHHRSTEILTSDEWQRKARKLGIKEDLTKFPGRY